MKPSGNARGLKNQSCRRWRKSCPSWAASSLALSWATGLSVACFWGFVSALAAPSFFSPCAEARGMKQQEVRNTAEARREVRKSKDWSLIVCPHGRFEDERCKTRCKTLPAGGHPRSQGTILRGAALRRLGETEAAYRLANEAYHTSSKHSLVPEYGLNAKGQHPTHCVPLALKHHADSVMSIPMPIGRLRMLRELFQ